MIRVNATFRVVLIVALLVLAVWGVTLLFGWVWDDFPTVVSNPSLHDIKTLGSAFFHDFWGLHEIPARSGYWRPLPTVIYTLATLVFGTHAMPFHLICVLVHGGVAVLAVLLLQRLGLEGVGLLVGALFFALHPIHSETVSFVSALPDLLAALFGLGALVVWPKRFWLGTLLFAGALLSKESAIAFAFVGVWLNWRSRPGWLAVILPVCGVYSVAHFWVTGGTGVRDLWGGSVSSHLGTVLRLIPYSAFLTLIPIGTTPTRIFTLSSGVLNWATVTSVATLALVIILAWRFRKSAPIAARGIVLFGLFYLPVSNLIPAEGLLVDRYLYLPALGTAAIVGSLAAWIVPYMRTRDLWIAITLLIVWGGWAAQASQKWKSDDSLWNAATVSSPESPVAWNELGGVFLTKREFKDALAAFDRALELRPAYREASFNRAVTSYRMGDLAGAKSGLEKHLERFPTDAEGWDLAGTVAVTLRDLSKGIDCGVRAVRFEPGNWKWRYNLGLTYVQVRDLSSAATELEEARKLTNGRHEVLSKLGGVFLLAGEWRKSADVFAEVTRRWPEDEEGGRALKQIRDIMAVTGDR
ncbi:MAG: tetratricopeptide repeat protein [Pseudomonadota bacterium]